MAAATAHVLPEDSEVRDGRLLIGGCDAEALAREHGTPVYVFAEDDLRARARAFTTALAAHHDGPGEVVFASKALPCTPVLRLFAEEGLGCDVASGGELHLALHAGFAPERIYLHGNAKSRAELAMAVEAGVGTIVLDNGEGRGGSPSCSAAAPSACCCGSPRASTRTPTRRSSPARPARSSASRQSTPAR
jgi:diaminopimelate decarboxylase